MIRAVRDVDLRATFPTRQEVEDEIAAMNTNLGDLKLVVRSGKCCDKTDLWKVRGCTEKVSGRDGFLHASVRRRSQKQQQMFYPKVGADCAARIVIPETLDCESVDKTRDPAL